MSTAVDCLYAPSESDDVAITEADGGSLPAVVTASPTSPPIAKKRWDSLTPAAIEVILWAVKFKVEANIPDEKFGELLKKLRTFWFSINSQREDSCSDSLRTQTKFPITWKNALSVLHELGMSKCNLYGLCIAHGEVHFFEGPTDRCEKCDGLKRDAVTQATLSIRSILEQELESPLTVLKLLEHLEEGWFILLF